MPFPGNRNFLRGIAFIIQLRYIRPIMKILLFAVSVSYSLLSIVTLEAALLPGGTAGDWNGL